MAYTPESTEQLSREVVQPAPPVRKYWHFSVALLTAAKIARPIISERSGGAQPTWLATRMDNWTTIHSAPLLADLAMPRTVMRPWAVATTMLPVDTAA